MLWTSRSELEGKFSTFPRQGSQSTLEVTPSQVLDTDGGRRSGQDAVVANSRLHQFFPNQN
jgi:hypothetical protein